jgi:hypothetical protein
VIIFDNKDLTSFMVDGALLGRSGAVRVVQRIPGGLVLRKPKLFSRSREFEFCEFEVNGTRFSVEEEEIGGKYSIGPKGTATQGTLELVRQAFAAARPVFGFLLPAREA